MSWSFYGVGRSASVLAKARTELDRINCAEPEETIKHKVLDILTASLLAMPPGSAVDVKASGSQSMVDYSDASKGVSNQLIIEIKPLFGFVE